MKKIIFLAALALGFASLIDAAIVGNNQPQSGSYYYTNATPLGRFTNSFPYAFTKAPVIVLTGTAGPFTVNSITSSNFDVSVTSTNNTSLSYSAYIGYPRIQTGVAATTTLLATNITFAVPYAAVPIVTIGTGGTNASVAAVTAVTTTNFTIRSNIGSTNQWSAIGDAYAPGASTVTY